MGYRRQYAIVVSSYDDTFLAAAHKRARDEFGKEMVSDLCGLSHWQSFMVAHSGYKIAKPDDPRSCPECQLVDAYMTWLDGFRYSDDSTPIAYVQVQYGDDDLDTKVLRDSDRFARRRDLTTMRK